MESIPMIDRDSAVASSLRNYLAAQGLDLVFTRQASRIYETCGDVRFDLILLEVTFGAADGFHTVRQFRRAADVPVVLLASRAHVDDAISGLESGDDDYLTTPVNSRELVARIRAILRRRSSQAGFKPSLRPGKRLCVEGFQLDTATRIAHYRGYPLILTDAEFALLHALLESPGIVVPRECLADRLYRRPFHPLDRRLDVLVSRLRRKLNLENSRGKAIRTIRGSG